MTQKTLGQTAEEYQPTKTLNVTDLPNGIVNVMDKTEERSGTDREEKAYYYTVIIREGKEYRIPKTVIESIQDYLLEMKAITEFKVTKSGEGKATKYKVMPVLEPIKE